MGEMPKKLLAEGKTKRIREGSKLGFVLIEDKPVLTAGDGAKREELMGKDKSSTTIACNIFKLLELNGVKTHFVEKMSVTSFHALYCDMVPIEVVVRRTVPPGSGYAKRNPEVAKGTVFEKLVVEFFLKDDERHDPFIIIDKYGEWSLFEDKKPLCGETFLGTIDPLLKPSEVSYVEDRAIQVFLILEKAWADLGVVQHDFKIEFGRVKLGSRKGQLVVADTITGDECRLTEDGKVLDKQLFRDGGKMETIGKNYRHIANLTEKFFRKI